MRKWERRLGCAYFHSAYLDGRFAMMRRSASLRSRTMSTNYLFIRARVFDVLERQRFTLQDEVEHLAPAMLHSSPQEELLQLLSSKYKMEIPVLEEDKAQVSYQEVDVDVSQDPMRMILDRSKPFYIKGVQIVFSV